VTHWGFIQYSFRTRTCQSIIDFTNLSGKIGSLLNFDSDTLRKRISQLNLEILPGMCVVILGGDENGFFPPPGDLEGESGIVVKVDSNNALYVRTRKGADWFDRGQLRFASPKEMLDLE
jgi:hypothetical protein